MKSIDTLKQLSASVIESLIESAGFDAEHYSGRGMNGKECPALSVQSSDLLAAVAHLVANQDSEPERLDMTLALDYAQTDDMGRDSTVLYFPKWTYEDTP